MAKDLIPLSYVDVKRVTSRNSIPNSIKCLCIQIIWFPVGVVLMWIAGDIDIDGHPFKSLLGYMTIGTPSIVGSWLAIRELLYVRVRPAPRWNTCLSVLAAILGLAFIVMLVWMAFHDRAGTTSL